MRIKSFSIMALCICTMLWLNMCGEHPFIFESFMPIMVPLNLNQ